MYSDLCVVNQSLEQTEQVYTAGPFWQISCLQQQPVAGAQGNSKESDLHLTLDQTVHWNFPPAITGPLHSNGSKLKNQLQFSGQQIKVNSNLQQQSVH